MMKNHLDCFFKEEHTAKLMNSTIPKNSKIFVAGHRGLVGSAIVRKLKSQGYVNVITRSKLELDLLNQKEVNDFFASQNIEYVLIAAAKVGGIVANNTQQADFLYENLMIACNVIHAAAKYNVTKLLFLGSACIYPRLAPQPLKEEYLMTGALEPTNEGYAIAKIAGLMLCEKVKKQYGKRFISAMPTNLYGPNDNFHPIYSHVIPGMLRRFHEAKISNSPEVVIWGTGTPKREFLHVDDLADALLILMDKYEESQTINVGTGNDITTLELAKIIKKATGFKGVIKLDKTKPDGPPRRVFDINRIKTLGWEPKISLIDGIQDAYNWAIENRVFENNNYVRQ